MCTSDFESLGPDKGCSSDLCTNLSPSVFPLRIEVIPNHAKGAVPRSVFASDDVMTAGQGGNVSVSLSLYFFLALIYCTHTFSSLLHTHTHTHTHTDNVTQTPITVT